MERCSTPSTVLDTGATAVNQANSLPYLSNVLPGGTVKAGETCYVGRGKYNRKVYDGRCFPIFVKSIATK